jgi:hypothetical protein
VTVVRPELKQIVAALGVAAGLAVAANALAQPFPRQDLPPELRPWVPWVLDQVPDLGCVHVRGQAVCVWPGRLRLALGAAGGGFALEVHADRESDLRLPGSAEAWPLDVSLDGRAIPLFDRGSTPRLRLPEGRHRVAGRFVWSRMPESLQVPPEIALVDLSLDGRAVPRPRREAGGLLWLRARADAGVGEADSLRLQVFRHVEDGIPLFVETRLQLEVAGRARETTLSGALLPGTTAVGVSGGLPARVEDGGLRVQVRPGTYTVSVLARVDGRPDALECPKPQRAGGAAWPGREVWVFAANETLRQVELSGPAPIDPSRTELPTEWRNLPAFLLEPGGRLVLKTVRRGQPEAAPDALQLTRVLWLDPDGRAASVRDVFSGTLHSATRLDLLPPATLGRVASFGEDQLVTENPRTNASGVELRRADVGLEADSRLVLGGPLAAVGWSSGVDELHATLNLPPGWSVLAASGVDSFPGTWTSRFSLLSFFFILLVAFGVHRLFGTGPALLAAATLVLTQGEAGAPFLVWLSLICAIALRRVAPEGRLGSLGRIWYLASALILLLLLLPFARDQVKDALFPQVASPAPGFPVTAEVAGGVPGGVAGAAVGDVAKTRAARPAALAATPERMADQPQAAREEAEDKLENMAKQSALSSGRAGYAQYVQLEQDPKAVLQTGPGVPSWSWHRYSLGWTGPVSRDQRMRVFLAPPGLNRALTGLRLVLVGLLTWLLLSGRWPRLPRRAAAEAFPVAAALGALLLLAPEARAQSGTPPADILEELKRRLTRPPACEPACVTTPELLLRLSSGQLAVSAEVQAAADGTWPVPGPLASWAAADLRLDGAPAAAVALLQDGFLHVRLSPGVHRLQAWGPAPAGDSFTLQLAALPKRARADAPGWEVSGLRADGPPAGSILFARQLKGPAAAVAEGQYPPWLQVTRTLRFGVTWTLETRVERVTPLGTPVAVRVPLLAGEAPTRADLTVERGSAAVSLGRDERQTSWQSTLEQTQKLALQAPAGRPWSEVWRLECSAIWSCAAGGLDPVTRFADGVYAPEFRPWPGESLQVALARPQGVEGQTLTLDAVSLVASPGTRVERASLTISARSSREQPLVLGLPKDAEVQQVTLDGSERPARPEQGRLRVTVPSGTHRLEVLWQQPRGIGLMYGVPRVELSSPAVNVTEQLNLPPSRWLLATWGPAWGPAVLFWPYLVFLLAVALALGRIGASPLSSLEWALLGLGLSQVPAIAALVVAGFVLALAQRRRRLSRGAFAFDLVQIALVVWALVSLGIVYAAIHTGLLFRPDMQVAGNGSSDTVLRWYADRVSGGTPATGVLSLPLWVYRVLMLAWALWLAASLVRAVGWGWRAFGEGGFWRKLPWRRAAQAAPAPEALEPKDPPVDPAGGSSATPRP